MNTPVAFCFLFLSSNSDMNDSIENNMPVNDNKSSYVDTGHERDEKADSKPGGEANGNPDSESTDDVEQSTDTPDSDEEGRFYLLLL